MDIGTWLRDLGLERYAQRFRDHEVDLEVLSDLTEADLEKLGIPLGHRKRLLKAIAGLAEPRPTADLPRSEAERRQLTVMFVDLVGSTALSIRLDPEDLGALIRAFQDCCAAVVKRWGGHLAKLMGDGALVYFGWPQAHEDDAERAVRAGLELARAVAGLSGPDGTPLAARTGIATGPVLVGEPAGDGMAPENTVVGETPNLAARLQALAAPGTVVVAERTRRLLGGLFALSDLGPVRLKGFAEPLAAFRVEGEGHSEGRFEALRGGRLTPLVGRAHELGILLERWARAKEGEGQAVLLAGEPGIGKSRLVRALRDELSGEPHLAISHFCSPYHTSSALHPVISQLERAAGLSPNDAQNARLARLEALLGRATAQLHEAVPLVAALLGVPTGERYPPLGLSPQRQKQRTLEILIEQLVGLTRQRPVLDLYEDLHWADPSTLELLDLLVERVRSLPALVVLTYRPEFNPPWTGRAQVTALPLNRLGRRQGAEIVARQTGGKALPDEVLAQILAKTDGVPLFVEELTKAVLESGLLEDAGERLVLAGQLPDLAIPVTLQDSLMARLDRLARVKEVAQIGAAIGREFGHRLLAAVAPLSEPQLEAALDQLVEAELIFRLGAAPDITYSFKHALVQDAAYQSLLKSKRRLLHARISSVLEARVDDVPPEVMARHCTEAGLTDKAVGYWHLAGKRAMELSAYREAINHLERARELLLTRPPSPERDVRELDLQLALGAAWIPARAYSADEVRHAYQSALELCRRVGNADQRFVALRGLWNNHLMRVEMSAAKQLAAQLQATAEETGDPERRLVAERAAGSGLMALGELVEANACFRRGMAFYEPDRQQHYISRYGEDSGLWCYSYAAWTDDWLGHRDRGLGALRRAIEIARTGAPPPLVITLANATTVHQFRRELDLTLACAQETIELADQLGMVQLRAWASIHKGWALARGGRAMDGLAEIEAALATWRAIGGLNNRTHFLNLLAEACRLAGKPEAGMAALVEAEEISQRVDLHAHDAETHRRRGELQVVLGRTDDAVASWLRAIEVAQAQGAKTFELRAAIDLARLWAEKGRRRQGRDLLAPIYEWFTEGFDTADLKEAAALIEQLD